MWLRVGVCEGCTKCLMLIWGRERNVCLECHHSAGAAPDWRPIPSDHTGRKDITCQSVCSSADRHAYQFKSTYAHGAGSGR